MAIPKEVGANAHEATTAATPLKPSKVEMTKASAMSKIVPTMAMIRPSRS